MSKIYCHNCGNLVQPTDLFCRKCGSSLATETTSVKNTKSSNLKLDSKKSLAMYYVTCPQCGTENIGSSLECKKCFTSLVKVQRTKSSEIPLVVPVSSTFVYDFFVDENTPRDMIIPTSHCSSCFSVLPALTEKAVYALYILAKFPTGYFALATPTFSTYVKVSSSFLEYHGSYKRTLTKSFEFRFPLCKNCFYDYRILISYEPNLYDPTYKEDPKLKRVARIFYIVAGLAFSSLLLFGLTNIYPALTQYLMIWFFSSFLLFPVGWFIDSLAKTYDKELKKGLEADAKMRYRAVNGIGIDGEKRYIGEPTFFKSAPYIRRYQYQLNFQNEQYRNLVEALNKQGA